MHPLTEMPAEAGFVIGQPSLASKLIITVSWDMGTDFVYQIRRHVVVVVLFPTQYMTKNMQWDLEL